jgi:hypothetical protein
VPRAELKSPTLAKKRKKSGTRNPDYARTLVRGLVPVVFGFPALVFAVPPLVIGIPAFLAFGVQIAASTVRLRTMVAVVMDRPVKVCLCFFDRVLATGTIIGTGLRRSSYKPHKRRCNESCYSASYEFSFFKSSFCKPLVQD